MTSPKELLSLAEKATPGPWETLDGAACCVFGGRKSEAGEHAEICDTRHNEDRSLDDNLANAAFIAAANPTTIKSLILALERSEAALLFKESEVVTLQACLEGKTVWEHRAEQAEAASAVLVEAMNKARVYKGSRDPHGHFLAMALNCLPTEEDLATHTTAHLERVRALEANQRTPGTVEKCRVRECDKGAARWSECKEPCCPIPSQEPCQ